MPTDATNGTGSVEIRLAAYHDCDDVQLCWRAVQRHWFHEVFHAVTPLLFRTSYFGRARERLEDGQGRYMVGQHLEGVGDAERWMAGCILR